MERILVARASRSRGCYQQAMKQTQNQNEPCLKGLPIRWVRNFLDISRVASACGNLLRYLARAGFLGVYPKKAAKQIANGGKMSYWVARLCRYAISG